ncbi:uncharacterized protein LOC116250286 isoform X15 [Nymphaea colorata]|uniref:uncharacterized protein LOC116250286 isoform X14 n=1 Tax=Nymphaea colorata TaxID=210225 RepID=UPI00214E12F3|nr:uncharacterized protein LOC116250286 isoform X14 [Nymphaea colorata]XP_049932520.1 uncharacterized protein LOC116250286 isoform X15 [Nymphaea colorata]
MTARSAHAHAMRRSSTSDEKMEWSHFIGVGGKGLSAISILTPGCSNSNQPFGEVGRFSQEARALLGWLSTRVKFSESRQNLIKNFEHSLSLVDWNYYPITQFIQQ